MTGITKTVWVLGDQLNRDIASLADATPQDTRILFIRSEAKLQSKKWHKQRLHLVLASMRRFAQELREEGFEVDERNASSFATGVQEHRREFEPERIVAMEPLSWDGHEMLDKLSVEKVKGNQLLCHQEEFAEWSAHSNKLRMEDFYRWQRKRLGYLMDGDQPAGGQWNFDADNREPPPKDGGKWVRPIVNEPDAIDDEVVASLPDNAVGAEPDGTWATSRTEALERLDDFVENVLPDFGPHEDAMLTNEWRLAHSMLSHCLNIGLLFPHELADAAEEAYREGKAGISSVEGFIRQVIGWREYIWNVYWKFMPEYRDKNVLQANRALPPVYRNGETRMNCMSTTLAAVHDHAYAHHIQRLMVLGNFAMLTGVRPWELVEWMWENFIDGAEWVMIPNVVGMALYADGGRMSTKPYAAGGSYINKMSDYCKGCEYNPKKRTGDDACPFTTLYWDFLDRHRERFLANHRMSQQVRGLGRLSDLDDVRSRAREVLKMLDAGTL